MINGRTGSTTRGTTIIDADFVKIILKIELKFFEIYLTSHPIVNVIIYSKIIIGKSVYL